MASDTSDTPDAILGQEFLTWLWFQSDVAPSFFRTDDGQPFQVSMEKRVTVTGGIHLTKDDFGFDVSVKAADFSLNSLKTPKIDKSDRDDDPDSLFLEKVFLIETAVTLMDCLYRQFLGLRLDRDKWDKTTDEMQLWMNGRLSQNSAPQA